jgi:lipopolysaccharide export LptBFGC system permease protein LptF
VGLTVHTAEVIAVGWSAYQVLMALNLVLPAALALAAWSAGRRMQRENGST